MKILTTILITFLYIHFSSAQTKGLPSSFQKQLDVAGLTYTKPNNVTEIPIKETNGLTYNYAVKMNGRNVEIRYAIRPIVQELFDRYENREKKVGDSLLHPNKIHRIVSRWMYSKISGGKISQQDVSIKYFKPENIKNNIGADVGTISAGAVSSEYGGQYTFGLFVMLHKDNAGDAYVYYLFENESEMTDVFKEITGTSKLMYALKFK